MSGIFTVSLDFELHWGVFDKYPREQRIACYQNTKKVIPLMLKMFEAFGVHVTWATVGSLFCSNKSEWENLSPTYKPTYENTKYSAYGYIDEHGFLPEAHCAPELIAEIEKYEGQELSSHSFSHYYCLEKGQTITEFECDLRSAVKAAEFLGQKKPSSFVFPRNQYNSIYLKTCFENGIKVIRSNPDKWFWTGITEEETGLFRKLMRTGDTYIPIGGKMSYPLNSIKKKEGLPIQIPASRFLRTYHATKPIFNKLKLKRITNELSYAAKNNECYHLWWHPEQFGFHPEESLAELKLILEHYEKLKSTYNMASYNMREYIGLIG